MKPNGLLVAVVILAAIGGGVYWTNKHKADEAKKPPATSADSPKMISIPDDQFKEAKLAKWANSDKYVSAATQIYYDWFCRGWAEALEDYKQVIARGVAQAMRDEATNFWDNKYPEIPPASYPGTPPPIIAGAVLKNKG